MRRSRPRSALRALGWLGLLTCAVLAGAECGARLDDLLFEGIPFSANPSSDDLVTRDEYGRHGRPYARFQKWQLDNLGFRGPDVARAPMPGVPRVLVMGASETFGLHEPPGREFVAVLRSANPDLEVINTAVVGMGLGSMNIYWQRLLASLRPAVVLIYPTPLFYLADEPAPKRAAGTGAGAPASPPFRSRFLDRLRGVLHMPHFIRCRLDERTIAADLARAPGGMFTAVPTERLDDYQRDLTQLVQEIKDSGARVLLVTHALRYRGGEPDLEERFDVVEERVYNPRASGRILSEFNTAANLRLQEVARAQAVPVIDLAAVLTGCEECFGDLVHFSELGSARAAAVIEPVLRAAAHGGAGR